MTPTRGRMVLLLTLVHPDFLPPVYAVAQVLRGEGYHVHILTFDSYTTSDTAPESGIVIESVGKHHGIGLLQRLALRKAYRQRAGMLMKEEPVAIVAFCAFTYLCGLKIKGSTPLAYHALEVADFLWASLKRSPLSQINNLLALRRVHLAGVLATPTVQRSAWLAGRCKLQRMPHTILNTAYVRPVQDEQNMDNVYKELVPEAFWDKKVVLYTGAVNDRLCIREMVQAFCNVNDPSAALIITGIKDNEYCRSVSEIVSNAACRSRILLLPYVTRQQMLALQASAHIGVCLMKTYDTDIESVMIAPNKVGEYLAKGLYLLVCQSEYMMPLVMKGIASQASTPDVQDIETALKTALSTVKSDVYKEQIRTFVRDFYCMQVQAAPLVSFIKGNSRS